MGREPCIALCNRRISEVISSFEAHFGETHHDKVERLSIQLFYLGFSSCFVSLKFRARDSHGLWLAINFKCIVVILNQRACWLSDSYAFFSSKPDSILIISLGHK